MFLFGIFAIVFNTGVHCWYQDEVPLQKKLFGKYDKNVRPSESRNYITVEFDFRLQSLVDFDVRKQRLTVVSMTMMRWKDPQLTWDKDYYYLNEINVDSSMIWTPDVVLYNTAESSSVNHLDIYKTKPMINYEGYVTWNAPVTWKVSCSSDITWFPVDQQVCVLSFGSWSYPRSKLDLEFYHNGSTTGNKSLSVFEVENGEWEIASYDSCERNVMFACCKEPFAAISYLLVLDRLSLYYFIYIILPLVSLTILFMLVFYIPFDSGERTGFGVTVLLSITVYLLVISEQLPEKSNQTPVLGICFTELFFILSFALGMSVLTMNIPKYKKKPPMIIMKMLAFIKREKGIKNCRRLLKRKSGENALKNADEVGFVENVQMNDVAEVSPQKQDDEEEDYREVWTEISEYLDRFFLFFFFAIVIIVPLITIALVDPSGRAGADPSHPLECIKTVNEDDYWDLK